MFYTITRVTFICAFAVANLVATTPDVTIDTKFNEKKFLRVLARESKKIPNKAVICRLLACSPEFVRVKRATRKTKVMDQTRPAELTTTTQAIVAGLIEDKTRQITTQELPFLRPIPLIGWLNKPSAMRTYGERFKMAHRPICHEEPQTGFCALSSVDSTEDRPLSPNDHSQPFSVFPRAWNSHSSEKHSCVEQQLAKRQREEEDDPQLAKLNRMAKAYFDKWYC